MKRDMLLGIAGGAIGGAVMTGLAYSAPSWAMLGGQSAAVSAAPAVSQSAAPLVGQVARWGTLPNLADLVADVSPSVVQINVRQSGQQAVGEGASPFDGTPFGPFFRGFPNQGQPGQEAPDRRGSGSGFFIEGGFIVTNHHVVDGAKNKKVTVVLESGDEVEGSVVGSDERTDLAVVKVEGRNLPKALRWGDSDKARSGDSVFAVGAPFGLSNSVTAGIISARGRQIGGSYDDYIQVDAPINRGNSGGPLFDSNGQVIGVNSAIFSPSGGNVGIGFSISSKLAQSIVKQIIDTGGVQRGWLGVSIQPVTPDMAKSLGLKNHDGAIVAEIVKGSPAEKAGFRTGDIILRFGQSPISEVRDLTRAVAATPAGDSREVRILRDGKEMTLKPRIAPLEATQEPPQLASVGPRTSPGTAAVSLDDLGLSVATQGGAVVSDVKVNSPAFDAGLQPGDKILMINQTEVATATDVQKAVEAARAAKREAVLMQVQRREGARVFLGVPFNE
jgi:serine protease Do